MASHALSCRHKSSPQCAVALAFWSECLLLKGGPGLVRFRKLMKFRRLQKLRVSRFGRLPQGYKSSNSCWDPGVRVFILLNFLHIRQGAAETQLSRVLTVWEWTAQWRSWRGVTRAFMNNPSSVSQKVAPMNSTARWAKLGWEACVLLAVDIVWAE